MSQRIRFPLPLIGLCLSSMLSVAQPAIPPAEPMQAGPPPGGPPSPPILIEVLAGNNYINSLLIISKQFAPQSRFGFFNITTFSAGYNDEPQKREFVTMSLVNYQLVGGLSVAAGFSMNLFLGFRPTAGLQYQYGSPTLLLVVLPRIDLTQSHNAELFGLVQYTPRLTNKLKLYTRVQALYNQNRQTELHDRSYLNLRAGLGVRTFQAGVGINFDQYGPLPVTGTNVGVFVRAEIFN